ncbi:putative RING-H2 finger protein ATL71 [Bidens hawaiensis]|uniref:putative RING-H2 finger protein ATL71 n=1 Tax=Bidens hawaiensis TaxID=980011 RepID=UPI00404AE03D
MASPLSPHPLNMIKTTIHAGEPPISTGGEPERHVAYDVGFALIVLLFIIILTYTSYMCNRYTRSRSPPHPSTSFHTTTADSDTDDSHSITLSTGLEDNILSNFPTFVYSEAMKPSKVNKGQDTCIETHVNINNCDSGCPICLGEYELTDILRLLPECGHWFHVGCIDMWLKVHVTCPVCRNSPVPVSTELT